MYIVTLYATNSSDAYEGQTESISLKINDKEELDFLIQLMIKNNGSIEIEEGK